ncbi:hypothetical protein Anapl_13267 [Anas platyrhynchos]|uniref:Uncharacterized protein n=1 Tax=Anas platyrhynchos TaxID=8839 RepID=R0LBA5_ANAPL|nr:hypothetical protein Anapl_13267 [Anas platyrhynchos]
MYLHWRSGGLELAVVVGANGPKLQRAAWPGWPHGRECADGAPGAFTEACKLGMVTPQHPAVYLRAFAPRGRLGVLLRKIEGCQPSDRFPVAELNFSGKAVPRRPARSARQERDAAQSHLAEAGIFNSAGLAAAHSEDEGGTPAGGSTPAVAGSPGAASWQVSARRHFSSEGFWIKSHIAGQARRASNTSCEFTADPCSTVTTFAFVFAIQRCTVNKVTAARSILCRPELLPQHLSEGLSIGHVPRIASSIRPGKYSFGPGVPSTCFEKGVPATGIRDCGGSVPCCGLPALPQRGLLAARLSGGETEHFEGLRATTLRLPSLMGSFACASVSVHALLLSSPLAV